MAEAHPVGFQYVVEAKNRGAKVIHVDPRFTRTSALAHTYVPVRAGADIAFLGGVINYILSNEKDFREYVLAYTNASTIVSEDFRDTEDLDGLFSGYDPETNTYDQTELDVRGAWSSTAPDEGESHADRETASRPAARVARRRRCPADVPRDPTLQHPRCVYQILKRHYARYTPEVVERVCGVPQEKFLEVCRGVDGELGPGAHHRAGLLGGLDPAQRRRAVHPHRRDHPAAAGQHGPARRRRAGPARARQHPGLDRHPDAVQPAARLPADAAPQPSTSRSATGSTRSGTRARRASGPTPSPTRSACSRRTSATPRPRTTTGASAGCRRSPATTVRTSRCST